MSKRDAQELRAFLNQTPRTERSRLLQLHTKMCAEGRELMVAKNHDYAGKDGDDPFANFRKSALINIDPRKGILLRLLDKISRLNTFIEAGELKVKDEQLIETCIDGVNYFILLAAMCQADQRKRKEQNAGLATSTG